MCNLHGATSWKRHARQPLRVGRFVRTLASSATPQICPAVQRHAWMITTLKTKNMRSVGELSTVCSAHGPLRRLFLARIGRPDIFWSVFKLARAASTWTKVCDKRSANLISHIQRCRYVISGKIGMWVTQRNNVRQRIMRRILILHQTLKIQDQHQC